MLSLHTTLIYCTNLVCREQQLPEIYLEGVLKHFVPLVVLLLPLVVHR